MGALSFGKPDLYDSQWMSSYGRCRRQSGEGYQEAGVEAWGIKGTDPGGGDRVVGMGAFMLQVSSFRLQVSGFRSKAGK